jgi:sortase A
VDWRRVVGGIGRALIAIGVLILLFVAYQLWGTGLAEAKSQRALKKSFETAHPGLSVSPSSTASTGPGGTTTSTTFPNAPPPPPTGQAIAIIRIPKIGVDKAVVQGVGLPDLKKGPGHYPQTPMPGQPGNAAIAGHRTTYGAPFFRLNELNKGDTIYVTTAQGAFEYHVRELRVVSPNEVSVLNPTPDNRLTLTTCNPRFSASQRLVAISDLIGPAAPPPPSTTTTTAAGSTSPPTTAPAFEEDGLSGKGAAKGPAILWGLFAAAIWAAAWAVSRRWRKWVPYFLAAPFFFVVLFVFFENFARLLPSNF